MLHRDNVESFEYITLNELTKRNLIKKFVVLVGTNVEIIHVLELSEKPEGPYSTT